ncbi:YHYH domain-containing protein [Mycobacteroides abscessus]|nr:YHYH domain-containing protein [Mycobacteroides abscessus]
MSVITGTAAGHQRGHPSNSCHAGRCRCLCWSRRSSEGTG